MGRSAVANAPQLPRDNSATSNIDHRASATGTTSKHVSLAPNSNSAASADRHAGLSCLLGSGHDHSESLAAPARGSLPPGLQGDTTPWAGIDSACSTPNSELSFRPWADRQPPSGSVLASSRCGGPAQPPARSDWAEQPVPENGDCSTHEEAAPSRLPGTDAAAAKPASGADNVGTAHGAQLEAQAADKPAAEAKPAKPAGREDHLS